MDKSEVKNTVVKSQKKICMISLMLVFYDMFAVTAAYFLALWVRFDADFDMIPRYFLESYLKFIPFYVIGCVFLFTALKLYDSIWKYASFVELFRVMVATIISGMAHTVLITALIRRMPISYYLFGMIFQFFLVLGIRFAYRFYLIMRNRYTRGTTIYKRVMIIGAGEAGKNVIKELHRSEEINETPVCIIDKDQSKWNRTVEGVPVVGGKESILLNVEKYKVEKIYFAIPTASKQQQRDILSICNVTGCELKTLPGIYQIAKGDVDLKDMKDVAIEDLLGRNQIKVDMKEIYNQISGKVVLITGGGGSIGSEIALQVSRHNPKKLIIFDIYENNAYAIQHKILKENPDCPLEVLIGSVRDSRRVNDVFRRFRPDIVYHAAAHKHVPLMEDSPCESIKNNVIGTYKVAYAAMMYGTRKFVLISTDKAVNPTNIMGASKRLCELVIQSFDKMIKNRKEADIPVLHIHQQDEDISMYPIAEGTQRYDELGYPIFTFPGQDDKGHRKAQTEFIGVRFGNVLGSNGSVIPLFKDQIASGGPVTVTHPDIIRYFMTIPEAASLVLQAGAYAKGGELFVLDMGEPVKIDDLARNLIRLAGFEPDTDIKIEYTGLRPGEKMYEEKLMSEEGLTRTPNKLIYIGKPVEFDEKKFLRKLPDLMTVAYENSESVRLMVEEMVDTFHPTVKSEVKDKQYAKEIEKILKKKVAGSGNELWKLGMM
ncbi:NDP-sugar epimerase, includes UDP-GlcNAc-inverting 4,6-dehydratase FlaA1 and capsular polysaccharide biosynthesis protein EpsC [Eubacterium ruminantium]|uniref:NDP-sugar epimerase, includes UDP-GlcNAc-inverting 4,6-dehydratase FlaA1 and capsular polysaccharide biosynthesis protein EpsC n=1 Tax=Eubacterium ruminantium TaxID=42322 RepID=A0A1T4LQZ8_9FIRM|nr:nucleoside-diphosphate sugar epimerase/dehydratase [Eubacterium ruminantium]SCW40315.1 NDP-sugar epimerase, includes UDP-GlcNAc-inverting 4,6-dehydratase FlaA1 and capsular polysaccharide biosynthesis protein EpsC [Eubacterium ruminantium]SDM39775.1 NDP-sugar epimerase, includes UDP-GlcNAc-inverting 4,6-dehydratase FlaA1 and capsular polysaccharide biosynthesis protein EpsC [Eubacterium ruminantium]SJZ57179.1 NDP-sugar epimerase, includes UDP-GlcNAc-inverting 4,6-dehydratase FlaA1 and capsula